MIAHTATTYPGNRRRRLLATAWILISGAVGPPVGAWEQFHGSAAGDGFKAVATGAATWPEVAVYLAHPTGSASPVVAPDGTVYVGTADGWLIAVDPRGSVLWRRAASASRRGCTVDTPAIGPAGHLYAVCTATAVVRDHRDDGRGGGRLETRSQLVSYTSEGDLRWSYEPPPYLQEDGELTPRFFVGPPRLWTPPEGLPRLFLTVSYRTFDTFIRGSSLAVIRADGALLAESGEYSADHWVQVGGGGGGLGGSGSIGAPPGLVRFPPGTALPDCAASVHARRGHTERPIVVACDGLDSLAAYEYRPEDDSLAELWIRSLGDGGRSSPAVFWNGLLAIGHDGQLKLFDPGSGTELSLPWPAGGLGTPASILRQIVAVTRWGTVLSVDTNGGVLETADLVAESASSPALSATYVYVNAADGVHTLTHDLDPVATFPFTDAGTTSPAIGDDGRVIVTAGAYLLFF